MAALSGRCANGRGFFVDEEDGSEPILAGDLVAIATADGGVDLFGTAALDEPSLARILVEITELLSGVRMEEHSAVRHLIFMDLGSGARTSHEAPGSGYLGRTLGMLQDPVTPPNPYLVSATVDDLLDRVDLTRGSALGALMHRFRARALAALDEERRSEALLHSDYRDAERHFAISRMDGHARSCLSEWRRVDRQLHLSDQKSLPGLEARTDAASGRNGPGFRALPCFGIMLAARGGDHRWPARAVASRFDRLAMLPCAPGMLARNAKGSENVPILSATRLAGNRLTVGLILRPAHLAAMDPAATVRSNARPERWMVHLEIEGGIVDRPVRAITSEIEENFDVTIHSRARKIVAGSLFLDGNRWPLEAAIAN